MRKRILHLLSSDKYSGAENVVVSIIDILKDDYEFVYVSPQGPIEDVLKDKKIKYIPLKNNLNKIISDWKPDILHAHDFRASLKISFIPFQGMKISHLHQNPMWIRRPNLKTLSYLISSINYNKIIAVSPQIYEELFLSKYIKKKTVDLPNFVDVKNVVKAAEANNYEKSYDIAFIGRLTEVKDPLRFIELVSEIKKLKTDISAVMIGDGDLYNECVEKIDHLKLNNVIDLKGFLTNPFSILKNSKVLVITSKWEGFGLVAVEAMALAKPVFATPVGGLKTIINNQCGKLCKSDKDFVSAILDSLEKDEYYSKISYCAVENASIYSDKTKWIETLKDIYS